MQGYKLNGYYRIKKNELEVQWPCESEPGRTWKLYRDDVLTKDDAGKFMKHTGLGMFNLIISDDEVEFVEAEANLVFI